LAGQIWTTPSIRNQALAWSYYIFWHQVACPPGDLMALCGTHLLILTSLLHLLHMSLMTSTGRNNRKWLGLHKKQLMYTKRLTQQHVPCITD
jgi:hypothetical protein